MNRLLSAGFYRLFRNRLFVGILLFMAANGRDHTGCDSLGDGKVSVGGKY